MRRTPFPRGFRVAPTKHYFDILLGSLSIACVYKAARGCLYIRHRGDFGLKFGGEDDPFKCRRNIPLLAEERLRATALQKLYRHPVRADLVASRHFLSDASTLEPCPYPSRAPR